MSTRRGPKVEPHENPLVENKVFEQPQEKVISEAEIKENLEKFHNVDAEVEVNEIKNKWEESGILDGLTGNVDPKVTELFESETLHVINEVPEIDTSPQPQKRKKRMDELNQTELRTYQKTGFLPEI